MGDSRVWLAEVTYDRLRNELAELLRQRAGASSLSEPGAANVRDSSNQLPNGQVQRVALECAVPYRATERTASR